MAIHSGRRGFVTLLGDATTSPLASLATAINASVWGLMGRYVVHHELA